jgi:hypothetical protein
MLEHVADDACRRLAEKVLQLDEQQEMIRKRAGRRKW